MTGKFLFFEMHSNKLPMGHDKKRCSEDTLIPHPITSWAAAPPPANRPRDENCTKSRLPENASYRSRACTANLNEEKVCNVPVHLLMFLCLNVVLGELPRSSRNILLNALHSTEESFATEIEE